MGGIPLIGDWLVITWDTYAIKGARELSMHAEPYVGTVTRWFLSEVGGFGLLFVQFLLTVALSAILWADGDAWGGWMRRFGRRLANEVTTRPLLAVVR